jgi:hypothetical protein
MMAHNHGLYNEKWSRRDESSSCDLYASSATHATQAPSTGRT